MDFKKKSKGQFNSAVALVVGFVILGIVAVVAASILSGFSTTLADDIASTVNIVNESITPDTTTPITLGNPNVASITEISTFNQSGGPNIVFVDGADFTYSTATQSLTWLNSTFNNTGINASYVHNILLNQAAINASQDALSGLDNVSTNIPLLATISIFVIILVFAVVNLRRAQMAQSG